MGETIRFYRKKNKLKCFELAEKISVNPVYITQIEKHNKLPSVVVMMCIEKVLGINLTDKYISEKTLQQEKVFKNAIKRSNLLTR